MLTKFQFRSNERGVRSQLPCQVAPQVGNFIASQVMALVGELIHTPVREQIWDEVAAPIYGPRERGVLLDAY